ncbi:MAG: ETC complex I subunit [Rhodospirillaceae bacterium]|nr:ETC complex I subunit [Rhodospirillaceae bacterium]MBT7355780.1 ETC complex I subunit [Rhodospirillaceae bacterium]
MSDVRIFQPTKNAMQSGRATLGTWVLEHEPKAARRADPLMGWIGSSDTSSQVRLRFDSRNEAVAYAKNNGLSYSVSEPKARRLQPKDYAANFAFDRIR